MITTHVLDLSIGKPATGIRVTLSRFEGETRVTLGSGTTDADGRLHNLVPKAAKLSAGTHELMFETGAYFSSRGVQAFHPRATITFEIDDPTQHYHVPLLVSPFGYTTYRGS